MLDSARSKLTDAFNVVKEHVSGHVLDSLIICVVVIIVAIMIGVVVYVISSIKSSNMSKVALVTSPIDLGGKKSLPQIIKSDVMPIVTRGNAFSFSFWLYLNNYVATADHKILLSRGNVAALPSLDFNTNPLVFLDKTANKMYIAISTTNVMRNDMSLDDVLKTDADGKYVNGFVVTYIDYVPLQRWVNVIISVQDGSVLVFVDGDLYTVNTVTDDMFRTSTRPMIRSLQGDLSLGDSRNSTNGFLTKLVFNNYAMTAKDISAAYQNGPGQPNMLAAIGMPSYALQSPIYSSS